MSSKLIGGGNRLVFYTATNGTTPTVGTSPVLVLTDIISTDVAFDDSGIPTISLDQIEASEALDAFFRTYLDKSSGAAPEDIAYEDGVELKGAAASGQTLLAVSRSALDATTGKRRAWAMLCALQKSSGSYNQSANTYNRPTVSAVAAPLGGNLNLSSAYFSGILVTPVSATLDGTQDKYGKAIWG